MTTEQITTLKTRLKYAAIIAGLGAALVCTGYLAPELWVTLVTGIFGA